MPKKMIKFMPHILHILNKINTKPKMLWYKVNWTSKGCQPPTMTWEVNSPKIDELQAEIKKLKAEIIELKKEIAVSTDLIKYGRVPGEGLRKLQDLSYTKEND